MVDEPPGEVGGEGFACSRARSPFTASGRASRRVRQRDGVACMTVGRAVSMSPARSAGSRTCSRSARITVPPVISGRNSSRTAMSKPTVVTARSRSEPSHSRVSARQSRKLATAARVTTTPLGLAGGARGVDDVGGRVTGNGPGSERDRVGGGARGGRVVQQQRGVRPRVERAGGGGGPVGDEEGRCRVLQQQPDAVGREVGVDGGGKRPRSGRRRAGWRGGRRRGAGRCRRECRVPPPGRPAGGPAGRSARRAPRT